MKPYPDTNFFTRLYLEMPDSAAADQLVTEARQRQSSPLPVTWLHRLETTNALQLAVFLGRQPGQTRVTSEQALAALAHFRDDTRKGETFRAIHLPPSALESQFEEVCLRHSARHGFRTYDVLHVASALVLRCDTFWSFDPKACKLAALEGLKTK